MRSMKAITHDYTGAPFDVVKVKPVKKKRTQEQTNKIKFAVCVVLSIVMINSYLFLLNVDSDTVRNVIYVPLCLLGFYFALRCKRY